MIELESCLSCGNRNPDTHNPTWSDARLALVATLSHALQILEKDSNG